MENPDVVVRLTTSTSLAAITFDWALRCFGSEHVTDIPTRALRLVEEAVELAQSCGVDREKVHQLVDIVFSRPRGMPQQEIGGVILTTSVLCTAMGVSVDEMFLKELRRVLDKPAEHFAARNADKVAMGLVAR